MKIGIYGIQFNEKKISIFQELFDYLISASKIHQVKIYQPFLQVLQGKVEGIDGFETFEENTDISSLELLLCLGGDGAILDTLCLVKDSGVPVLGINTGRLGFLSSISEPAVQSPLKEILEGKFEVDARSVLKLSTKSGLFGDLNYALNEITVQKKDSSSMMIIHAYVDDEYLNSYWADGLIVSTPTGSTGYSLSCSGPIIMPGSEVFVLTPIAPHNLNVRPLVIPSDREIRLKLEGRENEFLVALDSRGQAINSEEEIVISKGEFKMNIVRAQSHSFLSTLRNKLTWGLDSRN